MTTLYLRHLVAVIAFAGPAFVTTAQAPVANLPLTCPSAADIGQPQNNCSNLTYQSPTSDQLIVLSSNGTWARAASLAADNTLAVCALPVQPGTYSSCRDPAGVRRIVYVAKSQVFASTPPPPPTAGARVLDLSRPPLEITEPGIYVFDRTWRSGLENQAMIVITANDVIVDLQGFELLVENFGIASRGERVTIRNGHIDVFGGNAISASGAGTRIERIRGGIGLGGTVFILDGPGSTLTESVATVGLNGTGVRAGDDTIIRNNRIGGGRGVALRASSRTTVVDNEIQCAGSPDPCIEVNGIDNIVSHNNVRVSVDRSGDGLVIRGNFNHVMDNVFITASCVFPPRSASAITVQGQGNTIRDNLVPSCSGSAASATGIQFLQDGNFYGDNVVWATTPFNVGATVQTDLGGNRGFGP